MFLLLMDVILLTDSPEVVHVMPDGYYELATTRTWDYLGLSAAHPKNLLNDTNMGDHVIIGVIDTGISRFHHICIFIFGSFVSFILVPQ